MLTFVLAVVALAVGFSGGFYVKGHLAAKVLAEVQTLHQFIVERYKQDYIAAKKTIDSLIPLIDVRAKL